MRKTSRMRAAARLTCLAALGAAVLLLAGCATGYSFVQPGVAGSGGYYTGDAYSGQGYYDDYGTGPYYPGTSGYGYYNGTRPYGSAYGYYGAGYGYGYGSPWIFNLGVSSVWNFPGYWGPWYTTGFPRWGCDSWRCSDHRHWRDHRYDHNGDHRDAGAWRHDGSASMSPDPTRTAQRADDDFNRGRENAMERSAWRHDHYVRAPRQGSMSSFRGVPAMPAEIGRRAPPPVSFGSGNPLPAMAPMTMPSPQGMTSTPQVAPRANFRAAPVRSSPQPVRPGKPSTATQIQ